MVQQGIDNAHQYLKPNNFLKDKHCLIQFHNDDNLCFARPLVVARAYIHKKDLNTVHKWERLELMCVKEQVFMNLTVVIGTVVQNILKIFKRRRRKSQIFMVLIFGAAKNGKPSYGKMKNAAVGDKEAGGGDNGVGDDPFGIQGVDSVTKLHADEELVRKYNLNARTLKCELYLEISAQTTRRLRQENIDKNRNSSKNVTVAETKEQ
uniref:Uncharacterized protein n=1 Tax=Romanomermis culicivorax TaxID=13658 RepID=A0A915J8K0_ROMCU